MGFTVMVQFFFFTKETLCCSFLIKIRPMLNQFHCDGLFSYERAFMLSFLM